jgi:hypothetical protein
MFSFGKGKPAEADIDTMLLTMSQDAQIIGDADIAKATEILARYKRGKAKLEARIKNDELWWELRHWEAIGKDGDVPNTPRPTSAWLFNAIINKHADAMDNYPVAVVLPRERSDAQSADILSQVLPVVYENNDYAQTYSAAWWDKLKHGTAVYGNFWNSEKENGLGDIDIRPIDLLSIYWEEGIEDIQKSRNVFTVELMDNDLLDETYPALVGKPHGNVIDVAAYNYDSTVDTSDKSVVVDWYYKVRTPSGKTVVHYVKYCGNTILYASQNDPAYRDTGYYAHGEYPFVFDVLFPEKGSPAGFGYVSICRDPQLYIDNLSANILENSMMGTKRRFFVSKSTNINKEQFADWNEPMVEVEGEISDARIKEIATSPLDSIYVSVMQMKIDEMKETSANRDMNNGSTSSGVTAAAAISALQEAGNKVSRDMITSSYRAHSQISAQCIELMRQFYDEARSFRITGAGNEYDFVDFSNADIKDQPLGVGSDGAEMYRKPIFDLKISAQKKNPFSRMEQNQRAQDLYNMGFFNPERAQEATIALDMMDFEGIDDIKDKVREGQTLLNICQSQQQQIAQMMAMLGARVADDGSAGGAVAQTGGVSSGDSIAAAAMDAQTPRTSYMDRLAKRSAPDMEAAE